MKNQRNAFSMIELIFVIVILGILAAVAIPKLAATRTDAKIAKISSDVSTFIDDLHRYYAKNSTLVAYPTYITNVELKRYFDGYLDHRWDQTYEITDNGTDRFANTCIKIKIHNFFDGNFTVFADNPVKGEICKGVVAATKSLQKNYALTSFDFAF